MKKGFTLIELLVVIVIIGILATLATVGLNSVRAKARDSKRISDIRQMQSALELYMNDNNSYPTNGDFVIGAPLDSPDGKTTYMSKIPSNPKPWAEGACTSGGAEYAYSYINANSYQLSYCLANKVNDIVAGNCTAKPGSICDAAACSCVGKCSGQMDSCGKNSCPGPSLVAVTNIVASSDGYIAWDAQADATGYTIYRNTTNNSGTATNIGTSATNNYSDGTVSVGTTYYYWVKANNTTCSVNSASFSTAASIVATQPNCPVAICGDCSGTTCGNTCSTNITINGTSTVETYGTVQVGNQCWMTKNVRAGNIDTGHVMYSANPGPLTRYCYNDVNGNCDTDGGLYMWSMAMYIPSSYNSAQFTNYTGSGMYNYITHTGAKRQGICPRGWHIPSDYELALLDTTLDSGISSSTFSSGGNTSGSWAYNADYMTSSSMAPYDGSTYYGTNSWVNGIGAKLLCTSQYNISWYYSASYCSAASYPSTAPKFPLTGLWNGGFGSRSTTTYIWSSSQSAIDRAWYRVLDPSSAGPKTYRYTPIKELGISVRCVQD